MVPVVAAIVAAFFAGAIALYRERRLELQRFLVAARILLAALSDVVTSSDVLVAIEDSDRPIDWASVARAEDARGLAAIWAEHSPVLAGGLPAKEWYIVAEGVADYLLSHAQIRAAPAKHRPEQFRRLRVRTEWAAGVLLPYCDHAGWLRNPGRTVVKPTWEEAKATWQERDEAKVGWVIDADGSWVREEDEGPSTQS